MQLSIEFPADTVVLERIGQLAADAGQRAGFSEDEIADIQLAVDEACTNTIIHGLKHDPARFFQFEIQWRSNEIEILIHEKGEPFTPDFVRKPDTDASLEERPVGGLGVYFVHKLMDQVDYCISDDGVKTFRMIKRKPNACAD